MDVATDQCCCVNEHQWGLMMAGLELIDEYVSGVDDCGADVSSESKINEIISAVNSLIEIKNEELNQWDLDVEGR